MTGTTHQAAPAGRLLQVLGVAFGLAVLVGNTTHSLSALALVAISWPVYRRFRRKPWRAPAAGQQTPVRRGVA
jgi:hypothetical protein